MDKKYTISRVANGFVVTPDYKENLNRQDLNVFNEFNDMVSFLEQRFNIDSTESYADKMADDITEEDHEKLRKAKENYDWRDDKIFKLNLSTRAHNSLQMYGIETIREINDKTDFQLYRIKNMGRKSVSEMREKIEQYRIKIDERNRITLPQNFIDGNNLNDRTHVLMKSSTSDSDELILKFIKVKKNESRNNDTRKS